MRRRIRSPLWVAPLFADHRLRMVVKLSGRHALFTDGRQWLLAVPFRISPNGWRVVATAPTKDVLLRRIDEAKVMVSPTGAITIRRLPNTPRKWVSNDQARTKHSRSTGTA